MKIALISDVHGNIFGLKKIFDIVKKKNVDQVYFLGDAVNYFSKSKEVLDFLREKDFQCIKGNHEKYFEYNVSISDKQKKVYNLSITEKQLSRKDYDYFNNWEDRIELVLNGKKILIVHANPFDLFYQYVYPDTDLSKYKNLKYDIVFLGHTHIPFIRKVNGKLIVNVGSAGFCRDNGKRVTAVVYDSKRDDIDFIETEFPFNKLNELKPFYKDIDKILKRDA